jgi:probable HAF family extracellular repeat protein
MICLRGYVFLIVVFLAVPLVFSQAETLNLTYTTIDVPGAMSTSASGINLAGDVVGGYANSDGSGGSFLLSGGNFTLFNYPGGDLTSAEAINDSGLIAGWAYVRSNTAAVGFTYQGGTFTTIRVPGKSVTFVSGVDNAGDIVGSDGTFGTTKGFERVGTRFKTISPPPGGFIYVSVTGVNNLGEIVGWTSSASTRGFSDKGGAFRTIIFPGPSTSMTEAWAVNDSGVIVGWYETGPPYTFFGFALMNGRYISLNYPGAVETFALGVNNLGQVVGEYTFDGMTYHGFVTSPISAADF